MERKTNQSKGKNFPEMKDESVQLKGPHLSRIYPLPTMHSATTQVEAAIAFHSEYEGFYLLCTSFSRLLLSLLTSVDSPWGPGFVSALLSIFSRQQHPSAQQAQDSYWLTQWMNEWMNGGLMLEDLHFINSCHLWNVHKIMHCFSN